jgi:hypothetical protein
MKKSSSTVLIIVAIVLVCCCCTILILSGAYYGFYQIGKVIPTIGAYTTIFPNRSTPTPFVITRQPVDTIPTDTLHLLEQINVPQNNLAELACRFNDVCNIPPTVAPPSAPLALGAKQSFWVNSEDSHSYFQINATLRNITPHTYFWVADGVNYDNQAMKKLMNAFETKIYPTDRQFFGSEWTPGVDDDPHIYVLYTSGLGGSVAGYFDSRDEYPTQVAPKSNVHEMFYIDSSQSLSADYTYGTLAHEFQHMIHYYQDSNEGELLDEGFSELATFLNGYDTGGWDRYYTLNPDLNLTDWEGSAGENGAHYGANFLFVTYFLDRFGKETTQALVHDQLNGLESIDDVLAQRNITDSQTGKVITANDFFLDWTLANYLQDGSVGDGRYTYHNYSGAPKANATESISACPQDTATRTVNQYGVDYINITCNGTYALHFEGATSTRIIPTDMHSGSYGYWSNKGNSSDMTLTREFDLTNTTGPINMSYWTWYDLEQDFDYVYVEASTDNQTWKVLPAPSGTTSNPNGSSYGQGYTGLSNGWIHETIDLSQFAGKKVSIRFEYITDMAVNGQGFLLDDLSIPAINYVTDFETVDNSWQAAGFVRIENTLPQTFRLALVSRTASGTTVQVIPVAADQTADIPLTIGQNGVTDMTLIVTATTRFTRELAPYQFSIR